MKTTLLVAIVILSLPTKGFSQTPMRYSDTLTIDAGNFSSDSGRAVVMLFREVDDLPKTPFMKAAGAIQNGKSVILFANIPFGEYAAILYHDLNSNGILDHNWLGFPKEPKGFSNCWKLTIFSGMPSFSQLKFEFSPIKAVFKIDIE
jgi:uncharacterized protein (DUF2141 family)